MGTEKGNGSYERLRQEEHPDCVVCGRAIGNGLGLKFRAVEKDTVEATFACQRVLQGYPHVLHGGVICALLDGAMTNCLFANGIRAVTAELQVRYLAPVVSAELAEVRAWLEESSHLGLFLLRGEIRQGAELKARAKSKFVSYA